jgi:signal transduction histidine kinase
MWNLLSNAVKFTPARGTVALTATQKDGLIRISVEDTGIGMDQESLPNVFRRFWQADPTHSRLQPGLGLGLALARDLVELHGGTLEAHSAGPGLGARFDIVLPTFAQIEASRQLPSATS